jgi:hypothetical protein
MAWAALATQVATNNLNGTATSFTVTLPANATIGNRVVLNVSGAINGATPTLGVTGLGGTWHEDTFTTGTRSTFQERGAIWSVVVSSAATAITISITGGSAANTFGVGNAQEYSGLASAGGAADVDVASSSTAATGTPSTTTATTTAANELLVGGYADDGANAAKTVGSGFTSRSNNTPSAIYQGVLEDKDSGAAATQTANLTSTTAQLWFMSASA